MDYVVVILAAALLWIGGFMLGSGAERNDCADTVAALRAEQAALYEAALLHSINDIDGESAP